MNNYIFVYLIVSALVGLNSCATREWCQRNYPPPVVKEIVKDSVVVTKSDTIIKSDTLTIHDTVPCSDFELVKESKTQKLTVGSKNGKLKAECICKEKTIAITNTQRIKIIERELNSGYIEKKGFAKFFESLNVVAMWFGYLFWALILAWVIYRIIKNAKVLNL